jgi:hypothetical protein
MRDNGAFRAPLALTYSVIPAPKPERVSFVCIFFHFFVRYVSLINNNHLRFLDFEQMQFLVIASFGAFPPKHAYAS